MEKVSGGTGLGKVKNSVLRMDTKGGSGGEGWWWDELGDWD